MRILVFQHIHGEHPAAFVDLMSHFDDEWDVVNFHCNDPIPAFDRYDLLLVMGGPMDVWEEDAYPWLAREKAAIRTWVHELQKPYLGICLGHQLLADATGGRCAKSPKPEIGLTMVTLTPNAAEDPIFSKLPTDLTCLQWHGVFVSDLPENSVILAQNNACSTQIIRVGKNAYGVQFHPEVKHGLVTNWLKDQENRDAIMAWIGSDDPDLLVDQVDAEMPSFLSISKGIYTGFRKII